MLQATSFAFHVTYTCPLSCAHCCFLSSPTVKDTLEPELILEAIEYLPKSIEMVAFTGGEPFLHGAHLLEYIKAAKSRGFTTRVVTSAYFGVSEKAANKRISDVFAAGLDELSISWDDFHEKFVPFEAVRRVAHAAVAHGVSTAISSVQVRDSRWTRDRILLELGELAPRLSVVTESSLNFTGRALEELAEEELKDNRFVGPCPYVLTGPTWGAKGDLLACCGVLPQMDRLVLAKAPAPSMLPHVIAESFQRPLLQWLFARGPLSLIEAIGEQYGFAPPDRRRIGGNCEACHLLFTLDVSPRKSMSFLLQS